MDFKDLTVYQKAFDLAMDIFEFSKNFPKEEKYSLTDQIRRSSRSVCANIGEAYRKRIYPKNFISKLTDSDSENAETQVWLQFSITCGYLDDENYRNLNDKSLEIGKMINHMILNPQKYGVKL